MVMMMMMMQVNCCAFSPDCQLVLTCSDGGRLYLWKASNRKLVAKVRGHTGLDDREECHFFFQIWRGSINSYVCVISWCSGPVKCCTFSKDGCLFASASHDCTVRVWSTSPIHCVHILTGLCEIGYKCLNKALQPPIDISEKVLWLYIPVLFLFYNT